MPFNPASLANLKTAPQWQPGQQVANSRSHHRGYNRVLHKARKASPEAMDKAIKCMRDDAAPWPARLRAIELIIDRAWGAADTQQAIQAREGQSATMVKVEIVNADHSAETVTITGPLQPPDSEDESC